MHLTASGGGGGGGASMLANTVDPATIRSMQCQTTIATSTL